MNIPPKNSSEGDAQKLERFIQQTLRDLPARRAPRSLEQRVLAELERRAALPWWRKSYLSWPSPVRAAFFGVSAAIAAVFVTVLFSISRSPETARLMSDAAESFGWLAMARSLIEAVASTGSVIWNAIPAAWLYGSLAFIAACYATLIGVSAAAYRTLRIQR